MGNGLSLFEHNKPSTRASRERELLRNQREVEKREKKEREKAEREWQSSYTVTVEEPRQTEGGKEETNRKEKREDKQESKGEFFDFGFGKKEPSQKKKRETKEEKRQARLAKKLDLAEAKAAQAEGKEARKRRQVRIEESQFQETKKAVKKAKQRAKLEKEKARYLHKPSLLTKVDISIRKPIKRVFSKRAKKKSHGGIFLF